MKKSNHCSTDGIFNVITLDVMTAKDGIISTERETKEGGIMEDGTNRDNKMLRAVTNHLGLTIYMYHPRWMRLKAKTQQTYFNHHIRTT